MPQEIDGTWSKNSKPILTYRYYDIKFNETTNKNVAIAYTVGNDYYIRRNVNLAEREDKWADFVFAKVDSQIFELYKDYITKGSWYAYTSANSIMRERGF